MNEIQLQRQIDDLRRKLETLSTRDRSPYQVVGSPIFVPDAMVANFNGPKPFNLDTTGVINGDMGQQAAAIGNLYAGLIFRKGLFGKAVQVAEDTTNKVLNPSFEKETGTTITGWGQFSSGTTTGFVSQVDATPYAVLGNNAYHQKQTTTAGVTCIYTDIVCNGVHTVSFDVEILSGQVVARVDALVAGTIMGSVTATTSGRYSVTFTGTNVTYRIYLLMGSGAGVGIGEAYWDCIQVEAKSTATPYCDGSLGNGHAWAGTVNNSTSFTGRTNLSFNPQVVDRGGLQGSVMMWVKPSLKGEIVLVDVRAGALSASWRLRIFDNVLQWYDGADVYRIAHTMTTPRVGLNDWHHVAFTWDFINGSFIAYWDGEGTEYAGALPYTAIGQFLIGTHYSIANTYALNGLVANLVITDRVVTPTLVKNAFLSNAPVFTEDQEHYEDWFNVRVASGGVVVLYTDSYTSAGEMLITDLPSYQTATYIVSPFTTSLTGDTGGNWGTSAGADLFNVYYNGTALSLQNTSGAARTFMVRMRRQATLGTRN